MVRVILIVVPEKDHPGKPEDNGGAVKVSGGDGDCDQGHHSRGAGLDLLIQAFEKRKPAVKKDD
jgi:hypothetical protein